MNLVHQSCWKPPLFFSLLVFVSTLGVLSILIAYNPSRCSTDNPPFLLVLLQGPVTYCALPCCLLLHTHLTYSLQTVISLKAGPGFYLPLSCRTHSGCLINVLLSWPENWGVYLGQSTVSIARSITWPWLFSRTGTRPKGFFLKNHSGLFFRLMLMTSCLKNT